MASVAQEEAELEVMKKELVERQKKVEELEAALAAGETKTTEMEFPYSAHNCPGRIMIAKITEMPCGGRGLAGTQITVGGWVKTAREQGNKTFAFLEVNDGSTFTNLQVIIPVEVHPLKDLLSIGTSVAVTGEIVALDDTHKQAVELKATAVKYVGTCDASKYPLYAGKMSMEYLREKAHLRPRTNTIGAMLRVRNSLAFATHKFFNERNFMYMHTPLITASDCEVRRVAAGGRATRGCLLSGGRGGARRGPVRCSR
jgi:asparaginyl-tRNA synthetase